MIFYDIQYCEEGINNYNRWDYYRTILEPYGYYGFKMKKYGKQK